jgi:hypothetical protein
MHHSRFLETPTSTSSSARCYFTSKQRVYPSQNTISTPSWRLGSSLVSSSAHRPEIPAHAFQPVLPSTSLDAGQPSSFIINKCHLYVFCNIRKEPVDHGLDKTTNKALIKHQAGKVCRAALGGMFNYCIRDLCLADDQSSIPLLMYVSLDRVANYLQFNNITLEDLLSSSNWTRPPSPSPSSSAPPACPGVSILWTPGAPHLTYPSPLTSHLRLSGQAMSFGVLIPPRQRLTSAIIIAQGRLRKATRALPAGLSMPESLGLLSMP